MKKIVFSLILVFSSAAVFATNQFSDTLIYKGDTFFVSGYMDDHFPLYELLEMEHYKNKFNIDKERQSTACYRGYQAVWRVENGILYLIAVRDCYRDELFDLKKIFGTKDALNDKGFEEGKGVIAFWVTRKIKMSSLQIHAFSIEEDMTFVELDFENGLLLKEKSYYGLWTPSFMDK